MPGLEDSVEAAGLIVMGTLAEDAGSIVLLGTGVAFWPVFTASPEYGDGLAHPVDRWSKRVIGGLADQFGGTCSFPSDGPPYAPFISWALATGRFWQSPVGMMVHDRVGLMISIRGALHLPAAAPVVADIASPCTDCPAPCVDACPVDALGDVYDVAACHAYLDTEPGLDCMSKGCAARRVCPVSAGAGRPDEQSALHMRSFHPGRAS